MKNCGLVALCIVVALCFTSCGAQRVVVTPSPAEECAVLGFQFGTNLTTDEARYITDVFRVNFRPSNYKVTEAERVDKMLDNRSYRNKKLTKQQICELGRSLGVKYVVFGSINKLMDEYSIDVQVIDTKKETTIAFEGEAFQKTDYTTIISSIARKLASKIK